MSRSPSGQIVSLSLNVAHHEPLEFVESARFVTGHGIEGDHHYTDREERSGYQVLVIERETLDELDISIGDVRENVTVSGIELSPLGAGQRLALGDRVVLRISKPCAPCSRMDEVRSGLQRELEGRRGMLASVEHGGSVAVGDTIHVLEAAPPG